MRDLLGVLLFVLAAGLAAVGKDPAITIPLLIIYFLFATIQAFLVISAREGRFALQGQVVTGLFNFMNNELFSRSNRTRFTLFREAPYLNSYIIAWWRFRRGGRNPIKEADESCAFYGKNEGVTGRVWATPAEKLIIQVLPDFENDRALMEAYYIETLKVPHESASFISDYMTQVRAIVSYAFLDSQGQFLGLLSLDIKDAEVQVDKERGSINIVPPNDGHITVDADRLFLLTQAVGNVLESFQLKDREK